MRVLASLVALLLPLLVAAAPSLASMNRTNATHTAAKGWVPAADSLGAIEKDLSAGRFVEVEKVGRRLLEIAEKRDGSDSLVVSTALDLVARSLIGSKSFICVPEALPLAERALHLRERALGPEHVQVASSWMTLGNVIHSTRTGNYGNARDAYERALAIRQKRLGPSHPSLGPCLGAIAAIWSEAGDYASARPLCERALAIQERSLGPDHPDLIPTLRNLGFIALASGDDTGARALYERAIAVSGRAFGPNNPDAVACWTDLASMAIDAGDYEEGYRIACRARDAAERCLAPESPDLATSRMGAADAAFRAGHVTLARALFTRWSRWSERRYGPGSILTMIYSGNFANFLIRAGEYRRGLHMFERLEPAVIKSFGPSHPARAVWLHFMAEAERGVGDLKSARRLLEHSLAIRRAAYGPGSPIVTTTRVSLGELLWAMRDRSAAIDTLLAAEAVTREQLDIAAESLTERQALRLAETRPNALSLCLTLCLTLAGNDLPESLAIRVWDAVIRSRAVVIDAMACREGLGATTDPAIAPLARELTSARARVTNLLAHVGEGGDSERQGALLREARLDEERAENVLTERSAFFRRARARQSLGGTQVAAAIPENAALVSYVKQRAWHLRIGGVPVTQGRGEPSYFALVARSGAVHIVPLGSARSIDSLVGRWAREAASPSSDPTGYMSAGTDLRRQIWDPVVSWLGGAGRVFLVPDGTLSLVSFAALPAAQGGYLLETGPLLHNLSAERDLVPDSVPKRDGLLALGGAAFDVRVAPFGSPRDVSRAARGNGAVVYRGDNVPCGGLDQVRFQPLPGSLREVDEVVRIWNRSSRSSSRGKIAVPGARACSAIELTGSRANEAEFKREATRRGILHVATHGFFLDGLCDGVGANTRGIGGLKASASAQSSRDDPTLALSGLAMAGANRRDPGRAEENDGILTSDEIARLDLSGVRWAVLSACETGAGEVATGEGVLGLRRAFSVAGVGALVMSLWPVDDEATRQWMAEFYRNRLERRLGMAESVHDADLAMLHARRASGRSDHPFWWGGFVAAGEWR